MGLAVIEYFSATQLRGFMGFVAWLVGMSGNRDTALRQFHDVAENGKWFNYEAKFALAALYRFPVFENDLEQANNLSVQLYEKFPNNTWIRAQYDQLRFLALVEENGIEFLNTEFDSLGTTYQVTNPGILNNFGYTLVGQNRIEEAIEVFKVNTRLFPDVANGYDSLSEAYLNAGNHDMAIHYSRLCLEKVAADSTINEAFRDNLREISEERLEELGVDSGKLNI
jgi:tetratricopeptide (TPR) repeat protein